MADITLVPTPTLGGYDKTLAGCRLAERYDLALVSVALPLGNEAAVADALHSGFDLQMPAPGLSQWSGAMRAVQTTADQLMLIFSHPTPDAARVVHDRLGGAAYVTDQTDVWSCLQLSGPNARRALERICPIDLDPEAFALHAAARTVMEHMGAFVIRTDDDGFLLMSASSSARSFLHAVETSLDYIT